MSKQSIEIEADSLEQGRKQVQEQLQHGSTVLQEEVLANGKPQTIEAIADTVPEAQNKAEAQVPSNASVEKNEVRLEPKLSTHEFQGENEGFGKTVLAAIVGGMVALLVSPFSQSLSFLVNEYLARPILTIEYVEAVPEERSVSLPAKEVQALLTSQGYQSGLMRGIGADPGLMAFQGGKDAATVTELQTLKAATERFLTDVEKRSTDLGTFRKVLVSGSTEAQVREVAAKYQGPVVAMVPLGDVKSVRASLLAAIEAESAVLAETIDLGKSLLKALGQAGGRPLGKTKLKLSVLNRGSTDGLIRHVGELRVPSGNLTVKIRRSSPPAKPGGDVLFATAVPVAVTNPAPDTERATSVGKVEKNSMSEFWMEVDETATPKETIMTFAGLATDGRLGEVTIALSDHQNKKIERKVVLPGN